MVMKVFIPFKKKPFTQPTRDMCLTTAIKIVIDNQFARNLSLKDINNSCKYEGKYQYGVGIDNFLEQNLNKMLNKIGIMYHFKENLKIDDLFKLLEEGIYPIILFPLSKYNEWSEIKGEREVSEDGGTNTHALIIVGIDKEEEKIKMFDTVPNKFKNYDDLINIYNEISFVKFLSFWLHENLIFPTLWFTNIIKRRKSNKEQNLGKWQ